MTTYITNLNDKKLTIPAIAGKPHTLTIELISLWFDEEIEEKLNRLLFKELAHNLPQIYPASDYELGCKLTANVGTYKARFLELSGRYTEERKNISTADLRCMLGMLVACGEPSEFGKLVVGEVESELAGRYGERTLVRLLGSIDN